MNLSRKRWKASFLTRNRHEEGGVIDAILIVGGFAAAFAAAVASELHRRRRVERIMRRMSWPAER